ncbi:MAG: hypothetical protein KC503_04165 [Myxococcales bacterium]|nr:hypothetical protein [Myxococcales bacterium]
MSRVLLLLLLLAAFFACACDAPSDVCAKLPERLRRCDLPAPRVDCSLLDDDEQRFVADQVDGLNCERAIDPTSGRVDERLCRLFGWPCPDALYPEPQAGYTRHTLLFVSGIDGSPTFDWHPRILEALRKLGYAVRHVRLSPWADRRQRAFDLWQVVESQPGSGKVNLICWAVGGLDCRYMVSPGGLFADDANKQQQVASRVASITTISTPHYGTEVARVAQTALQGDAKALLAAWVGSSSGAALSQGSIDRALAELTPEALAQLNAHVVDEPSIPYFSWAGVSAIGGNEQLLDLAAVTKVCTDDTGHLLFEHTAHDSLNELLLLGAPFAGSLPSPLVSGPHDGLVAVASARWGTFRGCVPADHYDMVGQIGSFGVDPRSGFDAARFYANLAADLAARGL